jgi:hypothetical protein
MMAAYQGFEKIRKLERSSRFARSPAGSFLSRKAGTNRRRSL